MYGATTKHHFRHEAETQSLVWGQMEDTFALKFWVGWFAGVGDLNKYTKWVQRVDFQVEPN